MSFDTDLIYGEIGEERIWLCLLKSEKTKDVVDVRKDKFFQELDIDFLQTTPTGKINKIEVKTDRKASDSGNMVFETVSFGKDGCMKRTKADYVYYCVEDKTYVIIMEHLRTLMDTEEFTQNYKEIDMGENAKGYLIPIEWLIKNKVAKEVKQGG